MKTHPLLKLSGKMSIMAKQVIESNTKNVSNFINKLEDIVYEYDNEAIETLPNDIDLGKLLRLLKYSDKYEITIQFWPDQTTIYISKDSTELNSFGSTFDFAVSKSIEYLDRINKK